MNLYIKNKSGDFIPIKIDSVLNKDLNNKLVIVQVGNDKSPASIDEIETTAESFAKADILDDLDNVSVILTPHNIKIDLVDEKEVGRKNICIQIKGGEDMGLLEEAVKKMYKELKKRYDKVTVVPTPLTVRDYRQVQDTLERCKIRKKRRSNHN